MEVQQNSTVPAQTASVSEKTVEQPDANAWAHEQYVSFTALGGLISDQSGKHTAVRMTAQEFADLVKVDRSTLYNWRNSIPNFWDRVNARRKELGSRERLNQVWNGIFLKAAAGNAEAAKLYLANFDPDFKMPNQKNVEDAADNLIDLMTVIRKRTQQPEIQEGEVVDEPSS